MQQRYFGLYAEPTYSDRIWLGIIPFALLILVYWDASAARLAENASDKLMPSFGQMADAMWRMAFERDRRTGELALWSDTAWSLMRLSVGMTLSAFVGFLLGINMGLYAAVRAVLAPFVTFLGNIPALSLLAILLLLFGVGDLSKIVLVFIGTVFVITRDIAIATEAIPREQITKARTLGASELGVVYRVMAPQLMPRLIDAVRLTLGAAWLFVIAAEAVAAEGGLGYRIFLVRRYMSMDVIIPYVLWITLLAYMVDWLLRVWVRSRYPWYSK